MIHRSLPIIPPEAGLSRRALLQLLSVGGVVFASGLPRPSRATAKSRPRDEGFFFLQLSDTHWGYEGPADPQAKEVLPEVIATLNASGARPDFIVFTGDLTHDTPDAELRRKRLREVQGMTAKLACPSRRYLAGEHDAAADRGAAYHEIFGPSFYSFDHKGVHFIALDNVSEPGGVVGDAQRAWLAADLKKQRKDAPIVVFTHRPLFDLAPSWEWATKDGAAVVDMLLPFSQVSVFYGHIHQEHHHDTEHIAHHAARSLVFALPAPPSVPNPAIKKSPVPFDAAHPRRGLGYRRIARATGKLALEEVSLEAAGAAAPVTPPEAEAGPGSGSGW